MAMNYAGNTATSTPARSGGTALACGTCAGLECLCRPRFFAGQLLTEEDLNRLDHYIVAKHKLHNRYLHGWGVACGLDVLCDGCDSGSVTLTPGYALSPCGEDIVVCGSVRVPVCDLITACRDAATPHCDAPTATTVCNDELQQWVLAICYDETPSRGVVPLRSSCGCGRSGCSGGCGSGGRAGSGSGGKAAGCGCASPSAASTVATASASRGASLMQCEPTVVCEGYRFRVYKLPPSNERGKTDGPMVDAFMACLQEFKAAMPSAKAPGTGRQVLHDWLVSWHDAFADWFLNHPGYDCVLARRIAAISVPNVNDSDFDTAFLAAYTQFMLAAFEILLGCLCKALMPPCPTQPADDCVPLAVMTVDCSDGCNVQSICNWTTQRKYLTTFPSLQYWLSILPFGRTLREGIESLCCKAFLKDFTQLPSFAVGQPGLATPKAKVAASTAEDISASTFFHASPQAMLRSRSFAKLAVQTLVGHEGSANVQQLVLGMLGDKDANGNAPLSELESDNLMQFLVLDQMAKPMLRNLTGSLAGGSMMAEMMGALMGGGEASTTTTAGPQMTSRIDALTKTVESQQRQIDSLLRRRPPANPKR